MSSPAPYTSPRISAPQWNASTLIPVTSSATGILHLIPATSGHVFLLLLRNVELQPVSSGWSACQRNHIIRKPLSWLIPEADRRTRHFLMGLLALKTKTAVPTNASARKVISLYFDFHGYRLIQLCKWSKVHDHTLFSSVKLGIGMELTTCYMSVYEI